MMILIRTRHLRGPFPHLRCGHFADMHLGVWYARYMIIIMGQRWGTSHGKRCFNLLIALIGQVVVFRVYFVVSIEHCLSITTSNIVFFRIASKSCV